MELVDNFAPEGDRAEPDALRQRIMGALRGLQFGSVEIVVHNGRVVQIERREKVRLEHQRGVLRAD